MYATSSSQRSAASPRGPAWSVFPLHTIASTRLARILCASCSITFALQRVDCRP